MRQQNLGIADVQSIVEGLVPSGKLRKIQSIEYEHRVPMTLIEYCTAYSEYKRQVHELLGRGSFPWSSVSQLKQKPNESPLEYVENFRNAYENFAQMVCCHLEPFTGPP